MEDFLLSSKRALFIEKETDEFVFSDYKTENEIENYSQSDDDEATFEASKEALSEKETSEYLFTPVNLKSAFARKIQTKSTGTPTSSSTPTSMKHSASSPADAKEQRKSRAHTQLRSRSLIPQIRVTIPGV